MAGSGAIESTRHFCVLVGSCVAALVRALDRISVRGHYFMVRRQHGRQGSVHTISDRGVNRGWRRMAWDTPQLTQSGAALWRGLSPCVATSAYMI